MSKSMLTEYDSIEHLDEYEALVGAAILAEDDTTRDRMLARWTCKAAASRHITCPACGSILDQRKTTVLTLRVDAQTILIQVACSRCVSTTPDYADIVRVLREKYPHCTSISLETETWDGKVVTILYYLDPDQTDLFA